MKEKRGGRRKHGLGAGVEGEKDERGREAGCRRERHVLVSWGVAVFDASFWSCWRSVREAGREEGT